MNELAALGISKRYRSREVVSDLSIKIRSGEVVGLLGPNGAGKTTAVRILTTLLRADDGRAFVDGIDVATDPHRVRTRIGLTGQYAAVEERLTGRENMEFVARLFHLPRTEAGPQHPPSRRRGLSPA